MHATQKCSVAACEGTAIKRGMCGKHYQRVQRLGTTELNRPTEEQRFWAKVRKTQTCWLWTGGKRGRYGFFNVPPTTIGAHRWSYIHAQGEIPPGLVIDHICHVPLCVNPAHLQAVSVSENAQNLIRPPRSNKSGIRGVYWDATNRKWVGQATVNGRTYSAGHHTTKEQAADAVRELRLKIHTNNLSDRLTGPDMRAGEPREVPALVLTITQL